MSDDEIEKARRKSLDDHLQDLGRDRWEPSAPLGSGSNADSMVGSNQPPNPMRPSIEYPRAISSLPDHAYLRPLQRPLYDTEWYVRGKGTKQLCFFRNPRGARYTHQNEEKTQHDTNLCFPSQIQCPMEFSVLGFNGHFDPRTSAADRDAIMSECVAVFLIKGREYLTVPIQHVMSKKQASPAFAVAQQSIRNQLLLLDGGEKHIETPLDQRNFCEPQARPQSSEMTTREALIDHAAKLLEHAVGGEYYKFNIGRSAIKIKSGEDFGMELRWKHTPQLTNNVKITMEMIGLLWTPL